MMNLTPTEMERLTIFSAAELARKRRAKGLRLSYVEAIAYITDEVLEGAREGRSVAELVEWGATLLTTDDVLPGIAALVPRIMVDGLFEDGSRLIALYRPIRPGKLPVSDERGSPGEVITPDGDIELNEGRAKVALEVAREGGVRVLELGERALGQRAQVGWLRPDREGADARRREVEELGNQARHPH